MRMWRQYFLRGQIYGIDIFDKSALNGSRLWTFRGHQGDESFLAKVLEETGPLDIIIDDSSHINRDVLTSFHYLFPSYALAVFTSSRICRRRTGQGPEEAAST